MLRTLTRPSRPTPRRKVAHLTVTPYSAGRYQLAVQDRDGLRYHYAEDLETCRAMVARLLADGVVSVGRATLEALKVAA